MSNRDPIRLLHVEDSLADAELVAREFQRAGLVCHTDRIDTRAAWDGALSTLDSWDIVLLDHSLPRFNLFDLLAELRAGAPELPVIVVSGTITDELAVESLRAGARDFVTKDNLARLVSAVVREVAAASEVHKRRTAEVALQERDDDFRTLTDAMPQIVWITRPDGWNVFFNERWAEYTGLSAAESEGHGWSKPFHPDDAPRAEEAWRRATATSGTYSLEARLRRADGVYRWWLVRGVPKYDETGTIDRWFGTCTDIDDLKSAAARLEEKEAQLRQAQKLEAIGLLAGGVAHDFNNLLTIISGFGDIALNRCEDDEVMRHSIVEIRRAGDRAAELTHQLLAYSRQQVLRPEILNLSEVVSEHATMLGRMIGEDITLRLELGAVRCFVEADAGQLAQVLFNLATNARDAMPDGGELLIRTSRVELAGVEDASHRAYMALEVRDTGVGMDAPTLERMYDPFFTTKDVGKGTGLGLSTILGIVEQSHGRITIDSRPGEGSTFRIYLPQVETPAIERGNGRVLPDNPTGTETILLVEDESAVRDLIKEILLERGYTVLEAASPNVALAVSAGYPDEIQLVVTDVVMPEMNGRELVERIQTERPDICILYTSGYTNDEVLARGIMYSDVHFLQKPFTPSQLTVKAREALAPPLH